MIAGNGVAINTDAFDTAPVAVARVVGPQVNPVVQEVIHEIDRAANAEYVQVTASRVTPRFSAKVRNGFYTAGVVAGTIGTIAPVVAALFTGDAAITVASVGALALAINSLLAKLNLSKTAEDIAKQ